MALAAPPPPPSSSSNGATIVSDVSASGDVVSIDDVSIPRFQASDPALVPSGYLPDAASELSQETLAHLRWLMQKESIGQDVFLLGVPGPQRRRLVMMYCELVGRDVEYVAISRDTTDADLKQRRELVAGTAVFSDQAAVRAAINGRLLVIDGIEKGVGGGSVVLCLPFGGCCSCRLSVPIALVVLYAP